jgi:hypothetical protein
MHDAFQRHGGREKVLQQVQRQSQMIYPFFGSGEIIQQPLTLLGARKRAPRR